MEEERLYDVYALDEDIKILEKLKEDGKETFTDTKLSDYEIQALEHLIEAYRKVKEEKRELQNYMKKYLIPKSTIDLVYIPKSKIKEKIEELNNSIVNAERFDERIGEYRYKKLVLQELL